MKRFMIHQRFLAIPFAIVLSIGFQACASEKEEVLFPPINACDTTGVSFSAEVKPIIDAHCLSCHSLSAATASVVLEQYSDYAPYTLTSNRLVNSIDYNDPLLKMPPPGKLPDCDIAKIRNWVSSGAPNN